MEAGKGGGLSTTLRPGLESGGLESKFGRDLDLSTGVEWVGLVCAWGTSEACVLGYLARIYWFANCHFCEAVPTWLWSSTVVRTGI